LYNIQFSLDADAYVLIGLSVLQEEENEDEENEDEAFPSLVTLCAKAIKARRSLYPPTE